MNHEGKANRRFQRAVQVQSMPDKARPFPPSVAILRSVRPSKSEFAVIAARENGANLRNAQRFCRQIGGSQG